MFMYTHHRLTCESSEKSMLLMFPAAVCNNSQDNWNISNSWRSRKEEAIFLCLVSDLLESACEQRSSIQRSNKRGQGHRDQINKGQVNRDQVYLELYLRYSISYLEFMRHWNILNLICPFQLIILHNANTNFLF